MRYFTPGKLLLLIVLVIQISTASGQQARMLPDDFPQIQVNVYDDPEDGYIFITPSGLWGYFMDATPFLAIVDNHGIPVYYQELSQPAFDFKLQARGFLSFHGGGYGNVNHVMDSSYTIIATRGISGFSGTDFHEFRFWEEGSVLMLGWEDRLVNMDTVFPGGQQNATVRGTLLQEKDPAGNVTWQWSSWGRFKILETDTAHVDLTGSFIDYIHTNAVDEDEDGNILISSRNLHEITKIEKSTGNILWRMGGSQNQFSFIGDDTLGFSGQHHIRKLANGNYLLFDNGWFHPEHASSALELQLDEVNKTATVVKRFRSQPNDILGYIMGSCQRLPGGNTLVGWGSGVPNVTEFKPDGTKALELEFESVSYRAFKFPWRTNIFSASANTIDYGEVYHLGSLSRSVTITNHKAENITITGMHNHTGKYHCQNTLPIILPAGSSMELDIEFIPQEEGSFDDVLTIYAEWANATSASAFAIQLDVLGTASEEAFIDDNKLDEIGIFPNPTRGIIKVSKGQMLEELAYTLSNTEGQILQAGFVPSSVMDFIIRLDDLRPGIYFVTLTSTRTGDSIHRKIIRQ